MNFHISTARDAFVMITHVTQEYPARKVTLLRILDAVFALKAIVEMEFNVGPCHVSKIPRHATRFKLMLNKTIL